MSLTSLTVTYSTSRVGLFVCLCTFGSSCVFVVPCITSVCVCFAFCFFSLLPMGNSMARDVVRERVCACRTMFSMQQCCLENNDVCTRYLSILTFKSMSYLLLSLFCSLQAHGRVEDNTSGIVCSTLSDTLQFSKSNTSSPSKSRTSISVPQVACAKVRLLVTFLSLSLVHVVTSHTHTLSRACTSLVQVCANVCTLDIRTPTHVGMVAL